MMYNTMYGGLSQNAIQSQANAKQPIHIKIEDQTGVSPGLKVGSQNHSHTGASTKKQFQSTTQKFGTAIKGQHGVNTSAPQVSKKMSNPSNHMSTGTNFSRKKSKVGLNNQVGMTMPGSGATTSTNQGKSKQYLGNKA